MTVRVKINNAELAFPLSKSLTAVITTAKNAGIHSVGIGQLHDDVILLQLPESLSLLFSCAN